MKYKVEFSYYDESDQMCSGCAVLEGPDQINSSYQIQEFRSQIKLNPPTKSMRDISIESWCSDVDSDSSDVHCLYGLGVVSIHDKNDIVYRRRLKRPNRAYDFISGRDGWDYNIRDGIYKKSFNSREHAITELIQFLCSKGKDIQAAIKQLKALSKAE